MATIWDQNFAGDGYKYGTAPNVFLTEQAHRLAPTSVVLVPGDGEGRNGVWLARQGHRVTSVDLSIVGLEKTARLAAEQGVTLHTEQHDLADWAPAHASVDAVVLTYVHLPSAIRQGAHRRLAQALRPGGWLILESFHPLQLNHASGGPKTTDMLYTPEQLRGDFGGLLTEVMAWDGETTLAEGPGHVGLAHVTRYVGQRG